MSMSCQRAARRFALNAKSIRPATCQYQVSRRWQSTDAPAAAAAPSNPKIATIVDQISQLTLLETADLVSSLKVRHSSSL